MERTLLPLYDFLIMVPRMGDGDPSFPVHPLFSLDIIYYLVVPKCSTALHDEWCPVIYFKGHFQGKKGQRGSSFDLFGLLLEAVFHVPVHKVRCDLQLTSGLSTLDDL